MPDHQLHFTHVTNILVLCTLPLYSTKTFSLVDTLSSQLDVCMIHAASIQLECMIKSLPGMSFCQESSLKDDTFGGCSQHGCLNCMCMKFFPFSFVGALWCVVWWAGEDAVYQCNTFDIKHYKGRPVSYGVLHLHRQQDNGLCTI